MPPELCPRDTRAHFGACPRMDSDLVAVDRMHRLVTVSVEDDRWHRLSWKAPPQAPGHRPALPHCSKGRRNVVGRPTGETGMHSNGGIEVGVLRTHDARRSASGREARDVDPL